MGNFLTYARWWVHQGILSALAEETSPYLIPTEKGGLLRKINKFVESCSKSQEHLGDSPSISYIAEQLDVSAKAVRDAMESVVHTVSLNSAPGNNNGSSSYNPIEAEASRAVQAESPDADLSRQQLEEKVEQFLSRLESKYPKQAKIIRLYFGIGGETKTLEEIGAKLGVTREGARQIKEEALRKLRFLAKEGGKSIDDYL